MIRAAAASTVAEAQARADDLRAELTRRQVHPDVLRFCRAELLQQNYFHAVLGGVQERRGQGAHSHRPGRGTDHRWSTRRARCRPGPRIVFNRLGHRLGAIRADRAGDA